MSRLTTITDAHLYIEPKATSGRFALTARSGQKLTSDERRMSFPSRVDTIVCQYGERWMSIRPDDREFRLDSVYLQLLQHLGRSEEPKEIVAFHWHSVDNGDGYSNLPHLHVKAAAAPLAKSHLGVTLTVGTAEQRTVEYLDQLLGEAIAMFDSEVLQRVDATPSRWQ